MKKLFVLTLAIGLFCFSQLPVLAQDQPTEQPSAEELEKEKAERSKNAYRLLDQVIDEAQSLRLTENRVRVQIKAGDMLWDQNQGRARSMFAMAADGVSELGRNLATNTNQRAGASDDGFGISTSSSGPPRNSRVFQLRQELILAVARHDATLAYQFLASTKPPVPIQNTGDQRGPRVQPNAEENLEQVLLARIASLDPKLAAQNAEQMMEKGQFPRTLSEVINQLYRQDPEAAAKLADKAVKKIQAANILTTTDAISLAQTLLMPGPRPPATSSSTTAATAPEPRSRGPVLDQSLYVDLLSTVVDGALKVIPAQNRGQANQRRVVNVGPGGNRQISGPTEAQMEQNNARRLLGSLQSLLPMIDQYLPAKSALLRQKFTEFGTPANQMGNFAALRDNPTADALIQAAAVAPQQMQGRLYQQAAFRAIEEGDTERARKIATDHLQDRARDVVMQRIDLREAVKKTGGARFDEIRQAVARLRTDGEKVDFLIQGAREAEKTDPKLAVQILDEARQITNRRATNYQHLEQQLKVARGYATVDAARSFEILEPGIGQLNELLAAASVLSGFELNVFRDGEMTITEGGGLSSYVNRFGQELAVLARSDLERSEVLAGRFQFLEPRIMARLAIVQGLLDTRPPGGVRASVTSQPFRAN